MATYQEQFDSALTCETVERANVWLTMEIHRYREEYPDQYPMTEKGWKDAENTIKANLGYMAGYYDGATAEKINRLFGAVHPIFGTSTYFQDVSPEQAFQMGMDLMKKRQKG